MQCKKKKGNKNKKNLDLNLNNYDDNNINNIGEESDSNQRSEHYLEDEQINETTMNEYNGQFTNTFEYNCY